jgi:hypothetical protein
MTPPSKSLAPCVCRKILCSIPLGLCHCGCDRRTNMTILVCYENNTVERTYAKFIHGHGKPRAKLAVRPGVPTTIDGVICMLIPLSRGLFATVDICDYEYLRNYNWNAFHTRGLYYACRSSASADGRTRSVFMHREILGLKLGDPRICDHIDNYKTLDNRRCNLRIASPMENSHNRGARADSSSGIKGVRHVRETDKWEARLVMNGVCRFFATLDSKEEAREAYSAAAKKFHGNFARV